MRILIQHKGLRPSVGHLVHTNARRGSCIGSNYFQLPS